MTMLTADEAQRQARRDELHRYLSHCATQMSSERARIEDDPQSPVLLGRLEAHIAVTRTVLTELSALDQVTR